MSFSKAEHLTSQVGNHNLVLFTIHNVQKIPHKNGTPLATAVGNKVGESLTFDEEKHNCWQMGRTASIIKYLPHFCRFATKFRFPFTNYQSS